MTEEECEMDSQRGIDEDGSARYIEPPLVEASMSRTTFKDKFELNAYYQRYAKQEEFGVRIQRTKGELDGTMKCMTLGCLKGGKYTISCSNVSKLQPSTKTKCRTKINAYSVNGKCYLTTVELTHNHQLNPKKSRHFDVIRI